MAEPTQPDPRPGRRIDFEVVPTGLQFKSEFKQVLYSSDDWTRLAASQRLPGLNASVDRAPASVPDVEFSHERLIVVSLGEQPSACYGVRILDVTETDDYTEVRVELTQPAANSGRRCPASVTYPAQMVRLQLNSSKPVRFLDVQH